MVVLAAFVVPCRANERERKPPPPMPTTHDLARDASSSIIWDVWLGPFIHHLVPRRVVAKFCWLLENQGCQGEVGKEGLKKNN